MRKMRWAAAAFAAAVMLASPAAQAAYSSLYIFGDSLSDTGNNATLVGTAPSQVVTNNGYMATIPYASGTYSNGPVWATHFASALGLSATPSLLGGTNYAYGGAETAVDGDDLPGGFPYSLKRQTDFFMADKGGVAPSSALYILESGGNNARSALEAILVGADPVDTITAIATAYAADTGALVDKLQAAGAQHIVVWNTPNFGLTPLAHFYGASAEDLGTQLSFAMNTALAARLSGEQGVSTFDVFGVLTQTVMNGAALGLDNVTDACGAVVGCDPSTYLFWDAVHPTAYGHQLLANAMLAAVPEPATYAMCLAGLLLVGAAARRRQG